MREHAGCLSRDRGPDLGQALRSGRRHFLDSKSVRSSETRSRVDIGRRVAVIGGGMPHRREPDRAAHWRRRGPRALSPVARNEMPARQEEVEEAIQKAFSSIFWRIRPGPSWKTDGFAGSWSEDGSRARMFGAAESDAVPGVSGHWRVMV